MRHIVWLLSGVTLVVLWLWIKLVCILIYAFYIPSLTGFSSLFYTGVPVLLALGSIAFICHKPKTGWWLYGLTLVLIAIPTGLAQKHYQNHGPRHQAASNQQD
ncbi:MAG: hypothetical protein GC134_00835 [Proteobacteria bacterium]|nr:hypothetical protein [Pseudomonadota bacterium]